jgi:hypothetical protein
MLNFQLDYNFDVALGIDATRRLACNLTLKPSYSLASTDAEQSQFYGLLAVSTECHAHLQMSITPHRFIFITLGRALTHFFAGAPTTNPRKGKISNCKDIQNKVTVTIANSS